MSNKENLCELITENKENALALFAADIKVASVKDKTEKKISKLILANKKNAFALSRAKKIITTQKNEIKKREAVLIRTRKELAHKTELDILNKRLVLANKQEKHSKEKYIDLYNSAPSGYVTLTREGKIIELNLQASKMLGEEYSLLKDRWFGNFVSEDTKPVFNRFLEQIFNIQTKQLCYVTLSLNFNLSIYVCLRGIITQNFKQCHVIIDDISDVRKIEASLYESQEKYHTIISTTSEGFWLMNEKGRILDVNSAYCDLIGYTREELLRMSVTDIEQPESKAEIELRIEEILKKGHDRFETHHKRKDGSYINVEMNVSHILLNENLFVAFILDITSRKQVEEELIKAKEKAEESERLKSSFLTNMSHEIRTPMNGILGFTTLLNQPDLTGDEKQDFIQIIQISGERLLNTINNIVDISKIESGLIKVHIQETNINEKNEFTYKFFKPEVEIKGLQFLFKNSLPSKEAIIKTDIEKVNTVLSNLIKNAIKFTSEGSIEFGYVLKSYREPDSTEQSRSAELEFFIKDTGIGIPENQKKIIFERFRQGSDSITREYEGSGLGLSISKSYIELLGGRIWVESEAGRGSTFYFTIPYFPVKEEEIEIINALSAENMELQLRNFKILIAEDDEISYLLLSSMLKKISKEVLHAITGIEAVEVCRNNPDLDLVLMDIRMPVMDGYEATRQIRQFNNDVNIIAQTAYAFSSDREKSLEAGCNDYISKPINETLLHELIRKHCII